MHNITLSKIHLRTRQTTTTSIIQVTVEGLKMDLMISCDLMMSVSRR